MILPFDASADFFDDFPRPDDEQNYDTIWTIPLQPFIAGHEYESPHQRVAINQTQIAVVREMGKSTRVTLTSGMYIDLKEPYDTIAARLLTGDEDEDS